MSKTKFVYVGNSATEPIDKVGVNQWHEPMIGRETEKHCFEAQYPDVTRKDGVSLEKLGEILERLVQSARNLELREKVFSTNVKPVTADESACG